ncbi:hypothetical protein BT96DRAFT_851989 [Gymnopus androsaceus JB14]|uniref:BCS1 N-terminal domain-containing protein n=1 Tax=Gymnopus androsaceus JB14 TaxID=1447944 RepID=A0A6A4IAH2_9AGAR|nr:hypothetical protein BT96DRAFT_851989 [Gymnopus androsaceus JB14]
MNALKNVLSPLPMNTGAIQDTLKLVVIGETVETARRASMSAWSGFIDTFFLTAHFSQEDYPYDWLMHWLSKQPDWVRGREFEVTTPSAGRQGLTQSTTGDLHEEGKEDADDELIHGRRKRKVASMPSVDTTHTIYYRGHCLRITRPKNYLDYEASGALKISVVARNNNDILKKLVLEAKREYEKDAEHRVHNITADTTKRPMRQGLTQSIGEDFEDKAEFLASEPRPQPSLPASNEPGGGAFFSGSQNFTINGGEYQAVNGDKHTTINNKPTFNVYNIYPGNDSSPPVPSSSSPAPPCNPTSTLFSKRCPRHPRSRWSITTFTHMIYHHYLPAVMYYPMLWTGYVVPVFGLSYQLPSQISASGFSHGIQGRNF